MSSRVEVASMDVLYVDRRQTLRQRLEQRNRRPAGRAHPGAHCRAALHAKRSRFEPAVQTQAARRLPLPARQRGGRRRGRRRRPRIARRRRWRARARRDTAACGRRRICRHPLPIPPLTRRGARRHAVWTVCFSVFRINSLLLYQPS